MWVAGCSTRMVNGIRESGRETRCLGSSWTCMVIWVRWEWWIWGVAQVCSFWRETILGWNPNSIIYHQCNVGQVISVILNFSIYRNRQLLSPSGFYILFLYLLLFLPLDNKQSLATWEGGNVSKSTFCRKVINILEGPPLYVHTYMWPISVLSEISTLSNLLPKPFLKNK